MSLPSGHRAVEDLPAQSRVTLSAGRLWATRAAPYLAHAVLALRPVLAPEILPPGADLTAFPVDQGWNLYLDPAVLAAASPAEVGFWHLHHATHLLRRHHARTPAIAAGSATRTRPQQWWNQACDAETNDDLLPSLVEANLQVPARALQPRDLGQPEGQLAEAYFRHQFDVDVEPPEPVADCGSGVDGRLRTWDCRDAALTVLEQQLLIGDVARRIREAALQVGSTAGGWRRWADEILDPVVDWRRQLAAAIRRGRTLISGRVDYSYSRPSRRASATPDVILPVLRRPVPLIAVVIDTSGSMTGSLLGQALGELAGLLLAAGVHSGRDSIRLIACDAEAAEAQRVLDVRDVQLTGGGGTDMGSGLSAAAALRPPPDIVVVLTDGHTPWPAESPGPFHSIVVLLDRTGTTPPWATRILVECEGRPDDHRR